MGLCGVFMRQVLGCHRVLLTDLPEASLLLDRNIAHNTGGEGGTEGGPAWVRSGVLRWGNRDDVDAALRTVGWTGEGEEKEGEEEDEEEDEDLLIVAADCVYWESLYQPFFDTLLQLLSPPSYSGGEEQPPKRLRRKRRVRVLYSHVRRWKRESKFFSLCRKHLQVDVLQERVERVEEGAAGEARREITRVYMMTARDNRR